MYQTFPSLSWAYQSNVFSIGLPGETVSRTTVAVDAHDLLRLVRDDLVVGLRRRPVLGDALVMEARAWLEGEVAVVDRG